MKSKFVFLYIFLFAVLPAFCQESEVIFKVLASKGMNKYYTNSSVDGKPLVIGKKLMKGDKILVDENGYIGLAFQTGKTIEIKKAGTYEVNKLVPEVGTQNLGLGKKYIDFIVGEMTANTEDMSKNRHKYMAVTGSVERGTYGIDLIVPSSKIQSFVIAQPTQISWHAVAGVNTYSVKVDNMFDEHIYSSQTTDTSMVIDLSKLNPKNENTQLILRVSSKPNGQELHAQDYSLKFIGGEKGADLFKKRNELREELAETNALNKIILASFYEDNKLYLNSLESYEEAMKLQPEVEDFKILYNQFLVRSGLAKGTIK